MSYQDVKATFESKVKAGYDAGCYVATFEGGDKLTTDLCNALDVSAKASLAYFDGTEFGAFAAFSDYLHTEYGVSAEDCEFMYMMALKMQFKHMSNGGDLTEVLNSVKVKSGLDLFDKPKEEWTVNQKTFVVKLKHDEYYKAVLREIGLETTSEEFWKVFIRKFPNRYADISAHYLHFYSTLPAMIPNMTEPEIPITENLSHLIATIHRTLVWLVKSGEMSLDPYVITDKNIRAAIASNLVVQVTMGITKALHPDGISFENFKDTIANNIKIKNPHGDILVRYYRGLLKSICGFSDLASSGDNALLLSMNGHKENIDYVLWPIYSTWLDMEKCGELPTPLCRNLSEQITDAQHGLDIELIKIRHQSIEDAKRRKYLQQCDFS